MLPPNKTSETTTLECMLSALTSEKATLKKELIQSLWSNYGEIARYINNGSGASFIVKHVLPPKIQVHPRGWNTDTSHNRKISSYEIEIAFYHLYAKSCDEYCHVPSFIDSSIENKQEYVLIMEDLKTTGYPVVLSTVSIDEIKRVIKWLASFHANFLEVPADELWAVGSYWHLDTRQDEYERMPETPIKTKAKEIDQILKSAKYQTVIHGDAKLANFCFSENRDHVAAVDFQYVGKGVGVKDLQYFLGSCLSEAQLFELHDELLNEYFTQLAVAIRYYEKTVDVDALINEWRHLYSYACADFQRFLIGWSPNHKKLNGYLDAELKVCLFELA